MDWPNRLARRVRALLRGETLDREMDEEMRFHIDREAEDLARERGLAPAEARRQALASFGGVERFAEEHRDARGVRWLTDLGLDVRYAARVLRRSPAFTLSAALVLALGIGSSTMIFSAVDAVLVRRLPYPGDDRLVRIFQQNSETNLFQSSTVEYRAVEEQQTTLSAVGGLRFREAALVTGGEPRRAQVGAVTAGWFRVLGMRAATGRLIEPGDEAVGAPGVVVVADRFAVREFGSAAAAVGRPVTLDGVAHTVVGVLPPDAVDPASVRLEVWPALQLPAPERRGPFGMRVIARLKDGVTLDAARRDLAGISDRIFDQWASSFQDRAAKLTPYPLRDTILGGAGKTLGLFAGAVALVLLIAVTNVAGLMLVRATGRAREAALRTVLGASRARLARLLVTESVLLAVTGAVLGVALAWVLLRVLLGLGPSIPRLGEATIDLRAFAFAAAVTLVTAVLIGVSPLVTLLRGGLASSVRSGHREIGAGQATHALRGYLVGAQFALALPLLAAAGLLLNSFMRLQRVDAGFDPTRMLYVRVSLPSTSYGEPEQSAAFWRRALARVREIPGVEAAGVNQALPPDTQGDVNNFEIVDRPVPPGSPQPVTPWYTADNGFFEAAGVPLLEGRLFTEADTGTANPVAVVSRSWVRLFSPDRPALGRQMQGGGCTECVPYTIIGVVGDVKYNGLARDGDAVYVAPGQNPVQQGFLIVRTSGSPYQLLDRVRAAVRSLDPALPLDQAGGLAERVSATVLPQRNWATLLGGFAATALVLAAVGIFGMLSYLVATRQREIGVRVALGANRGEVMGMVVRRGMRYAVPGAVAGLVIALLSRRWVAGELYAVSASDPLTLAGVTALLLGVALVACWLPARRAASVPPMEAIRDE